MTVKNRILVTGGSGFIGSTLVDVLVREGHSVIVIDDLSTGLSSNHNESAIYFNVDLCRYIDHPDEIIELLDEYDIDTEWDWMIAEAVLQVHSP